jgi:hypothetical protein
MDRTVANGGALLENVGNGGTTEVEPVFFLGAQAGLQAIGSRPKPVTDSFDYGNRRGVGVAATDGMERTTMNGFMHGQGTINVSAAGD